MNTVHAKAQIGASTPSQFDPADAQTSRVQKRVQHAFALQDPFPDQRNNNRRQKHREEEDRPEKAART